MTYADIDKRAERISYDMWFEQRQGLTFRVTVSVVGTSAELMELARLNWDANVEAGCRALAQRP